ncbi:hypothetical protein ACHAWF_002683, partial [Thalassiosira exigua]
VSGCHPAYVSGVDYGAGDWVSVTSTVTVTTSVSCTTPGAQDCPSSGEKTFENTSTKTHNYQCVDGANAALCRQVGFEPFVSEANIAWIKEDEECQSASDDQPKPKRSLLPVRTVRLLYVLWLISDLSSSQKR